MSTLQNHPIFVYVVTFRRQIRKVDMKSLCTVAFDQVPSWLAPDLPSKNLRKRVPLNSPKSNYDILHKIVLKT